jgi:hypothetical protein
MSGPVTYRDNESADEVAGIGCMFFIYVSMFTYISI